MTSGAARTRRHGLGAVWWRWLRRSRVDQRVRWSMMAVLLLAGVLSGLQAWQARSDEITRSVDAEIISLAGAQSMLSQRIGRSVALLTAPAAIGGTEQPAALAALLRQAQDGAAKLETLLAAQGALTPQDGGDLADSVRLWQIVSERLWYRGYSLLGELERRQPLAASAADLQLDVEQALFSTQSLATQLRFAAEQRGQQVTRMLETWCGITIALLLALAAGVAEPVARAVRRHHDALLAQSAELERLALVAERTTNAVIIMDAERRIVWVNDSFTRSVGYTPQEAIGRLAGELYNSTGIDPQAAHRRREALDQGLGIRLEVQIRAKDGREYWIDQDVQPLRDPNGDLSGFIAVQSDITAQVTQRLQLAALLAALPAGVVVQNQHGVIVQSNPAAEATLGLSWDPVLQRTTVDPLWRAVREDLTPYEEARHPAMRTLQSGQALHGESMGIMIPGADMRWLLVNAEPLTDAVGQPAGVVSCFIDVTAQRAQAQLLELTVEGAGVGTWQWEIGSGQMACNDRFLSMLGYQRGQIGMTAREWTALIHPQDWPLWKACVQAHMDNASEPCHAEMRIRHARGHWAWVLASGRVVSRSARGTPQRMTGIHLDMTERKHMEDQLRLRARTDGLTQLPNRIALMERLQHAISRSRSEPSFRFAVLFLDLDRFKQVNDTLGHSVGDEMLRQIARRLQDNLRTDDALMRSSSQDHSAARIGGDEFVVMLEGVDDPSHAISIAQRLVDVLGRPYQLGPHQVHSSASIGIVLSGQEQESAESVLRDADIAMYEAKRAGRSRCVIFEPSMHLRAAHAMAIESDLRQALINHELFVVYQPIMALGSGMPTGVEALVRWRHPQRGLVLPAEFIPIAEESGLIGELGGYVLEQACRQFARWQQTLGSRAPRTVSVNMSRAQLRQSGVAHKVMGLLQSCGIEPRQLQLEITESLAAQDAVVQNCLRELKAMGVSLALDDFGTGYSSLSCLHQLPIDTVKIDRSFVSHALTSEYHRVLIEATIRVAQALGLTTVAEGIETPGEASLIHSLHCDKGQGYLFSKPLDASEFENWLAARFVPLLQA
jgi:diguanylate cyclase (GGDEF)-like protein/PAS domain S-box-containing protein